MIRRCADAARTALVLALLTTLTVSCNRGDATDDAIPSRPDIVVMLIDTLRADWLSTYGFDLATSPELDTLAGECILFENACSPAPWTLPSVVSLFTGRHVAEHGVLKRGDRLPETLETFTETARDLGYTTTSWHRNPFAGELSGLDRAFDICELRPRQVDGTALDAFFDQNPEPPYFLYIHNTQPHDPHVIRKRFYDTFAPVPDGFLQQYGGLMKSFRQLTRVDFVRDRPLGTTDNTKQQQAKLEELATVVDEVHNLYSASVRDADDCIGSVVAKLRERGRFDETLLIILADHGEEMGEHGGWQHDQSVYQELIHVPLLVRLPGGKHGGRRVQTPVSLVDVVPTLLDILEAEDVYDGPGRSLVPLLLEDEPDRAVEPRVVSMRHNQQKYFRPFKESRGDINVVVRLDSWKAILNVEPDTVELYDLATDPNETSEVSADHPELAEQLGGFARRRYAEMESGSATAGSRDRDALDAKTRKALEDLGYVDKEDP